MTFVSEALRKEREIYYPDSDGKPMADNTLQFSYIVGIKTNLEILYKEENVFVAGDLFWYPVEGKRNIVVAPDVLVAYDRPKGYRGSYKQWQEEDIAPKVVFEVLSQSNTTMEMIRKAGFYDRHGVEEFIIIDPYNIDFVVYTRQEGVLRETDVTGSSWKSNVMNVTMEKGEEDVLFYFPDGKPFRSPEEWNAMYEEEIAAKEKAVSEKEEERLAKEKAVSEKEEERLAKEKAVSEKNQALTEKEKERQAKEQALAEKERERQEKEKLLAELAALKAQLGK
ncbi:MAG: Uma2 family endonuclease [Bacteroidota bacterium]